MSRLVFFCKQSTYNLCLRTSSLLALSRLSVGIRCRFGIEFHDCFMFLFGIIFYTVFDIELSWKMTPFRHPFGSMCVPLGSISVPFRLHFCTLFASQRHLAPLGSLSVPFWHALAPMWLHFDTPRIPFGFHLACCFLPLARNSPLPR